MSSLSSEKTRELQILEHTLNNLNMQKQALGMELNEISTALTELEKTSDDVYRITGAIMIKSNKDVLLTELSEKKKMLELRMTSVEKQEAFIEEKGEELRKEVQNSMTSQA